MDVLRRNNVQTTGAAGTPLLFAHGFGCDQNMWRFVSPAFSGSHRIVLFDHVGAGRSDLSAFDKRKYAQLDGYAADVLDICEQLQLSEVVFVGHSVSAMIGILAAKRHDTALQYLLYGGIVYLVLWLYGLFIDKTSAANFVPLNTADDWLHFVLGVGMIALALLLGRNARTSSRTSTLR